MEHAPTHAIFLFSKNKKMHYTTEQTTHMPTRYQHNEQAGNTISNNMHQ